MSISFLLKYLKFKNSKMMIRLTVIQKPVLLVAVQLNNQVKTFIPPRIIYEKLRFKDQSSVFSMVTSVRHLVHLVALALRRLYLFP